MANITIMEVETIHNKHTHSSGIRIRKAWRTAENSVSNRQQHHTSRKHICTDEDIVISILYPELNHIRLGKANATFGQLESACAKQELYMSIYHRYGYEYTGIYTHTGEIIRLNKSLYIVYCLRSCCSY